MNMYKFMLEKIISISKITEISSFKIKEVCFLK